MKYFHLVWAALFRRKTRTILTLLSIVMAFLLFGRLVGLSWSQLGMANWVHGLVWGGGAILRNGCSRSTT